jgi:hypothetical protein
MKRFSDLSPVLILAFASWQVGCAACPTDGDDTSGTTDSGTSPCTLSGVVFTNPAEGAIIDPSDNVALRAALSGSNIDPAEINVVFTRDSLPVGDWEWDGTDIVLNGPAGAGIGTASVSVSDGCSTESDDISWIGNSAPAVTLSANGSYELSESIVITGNVWDEEDPISALTVAWTLNGSFYADATPDSATGDVSLDLTGSVGLGNHTLELSASDPYEQTTASTSFEVSELAVVCVDVNSAGMVLHMDEGAGSTLGDDSLHAQQVTLNGDYTWTNGVWDGGVDLGGTGWIEVSDPAYPSIWSSDYTLAGWISRNTDILLLNEALFQQGDGQYDDAVGRTLLYISPECGGNNNVLVSNVGEGKVCGNTKITNDGWHHVAVVRDRDRTSVEIYLDGVLDGIGTEYMTFADGGYFLGTNKTADNNFFDGVFDEWAIISQALSPERIAALATGPICEPECTEIPVGPVAWLPMDDGAGTVAADVSGNGYDLNLVGGARFGAGTYGGGLVLDGVDSFAIAGAGTYPDLNGGSFTISLRARYDGAQFPTSSDGIDLTLIQTTNGSGQGRSLLYVDSSCGGQASTFLGGTELCAGTLRAGVWYHLAITYDKPSGLTQLFVDGALKATDTRTLEFSDGDLRVGSNQSNTPVLWDGVIDDLMFFDSALDEQEMAKLHEGASIYCLEP